MDDLYCDRERFNGCLMIVTTRVAKTGHLHAVLGRTRPSDFQSYQQYFSFQLGLKMAVYVRLHDADSEQHCKQLEVENRNDWWPRVNRTEDTVREDAFEKETLFE